MNPTVPRVVCDVAEDAPERTPRCSECLAPVVVPPDLPEAFRLVCSDCAHSWG